MGVVVPRRARLAGRLIEFHPTAGIVGLGSAADHVYIHDMTDTKPSKL